jgi:hypothetical protein
VPTPIDLDQGGTFREWEKVYLGPGLGWIRAPLESILQITTAGSFPVDLSYSIVAVNVAGAVGLVLPSAKVPAAGAQAVPGPFARNPITISDVGGNAGTFPITIVAAGGEGIAGFASISITTNFGSYTIQPAPPGNVPFGWMIIGQHP